MVLWQPWVPEELGQPVQVGFGVVHGDGGEPAVEGEPLRIPVPRILQGFQILHQHSLHYNLHTPSKSSPKHYYYALLIQPFFQMR